MRALCMIAVSPGKVDDVAAMLRKKRRVVKMIMIVTGRVDICVLLQGTIDEINSTVIDFRHAKSILATETMIEVEVNMGW